MNLKFWVRRVEIVPKEVDFSKSYIWVLKDVTQADIDDFRRQFEQSLKSRGVSSFQVITNHPVKLIEIKKLRKNQK